MAGTEEFVVKGSTDLYPTCGEVMKNSGIKKIGVIGWGSQAPAQAQNLADTLKDTDVKVTIGLREGSKSFEDARRVGFSETDGTLGEMYVMRIDSIICLEGYCSILLSPYSISSGALGRTDLLSYSMIALALHNALILIITTNQ